MINIEHLLLSVPAILLAISFHELGHAFVAYKLGDVTQKYQGRLTLNPLAHLDPVGAIMLLLFRFGWAKPVLINSNYFKNKRQGILLVSAAGPLANVLLAWVFYNLYRFLPGLMPTAALMSTMFVFLSLNIQLNLGLAAFNLIPLPPLDGSKILASFLPPQLEYKYLSWARYGPMILIVLVITGGARLIINPIYSVLLKLVATLSL
ncbi:MAG TPA: site-2 protease family protein [Firmicutes bacterium]|nr:site-2 protease family protein [Bacillota bacterium]